MVRSGTIAGRFCDVTPVYDALETLRYSRFRVATIMKTFGVSSLAPRQCLDHHSVSFSTGFV